MITNETHERKPTLEEMIAEAEKRHQEQLDKHRPKPESDAEHDKGEKDGTPLGTTSVPESAPAESEPEH